MAGVPVATWNPTPFAIMSDSDAVNCIFMFEVAPLPFHGLSSVTVPLATLTPMTAYMWLAARFFEAFPLTVLINTSLPEVRADCIACNSEVCWAEVVRLGE